MLFASRNGRRKGGTFTKENDMKTSSGTEIDGICIHCSDPRAFLWKNIKSKIILQSEMFIPLGFLGGAISLARPEEFATEFDFLLAQIHFAKGTFPSAKNIINVGHDCGYYQAIGLEATLEEKKADIIESCKFLQENFPDMTVVGYFAYGDDVEFERVFN